ncbi:MAG TPA: GyrI-like domain-containing protein, partial [Propionicimonas sp.]|nr:GyrI-like domain-containing protein [Propionicimonas sp.]
SDLRFDTLTEGLVVQTLHLGSYDDEGPVLATLHHEFLPSESLVPSGKHHEVYLNDARRTPPEKLRTILRQPVARG